MAVSVATIGVPIFDVRVTKAHQCVFALLKEKRTVWKVHKHTHTQRRDKRNIQKQRQSGTKKRVQKMKCNGKAHWQHSKHQTITEDDKGVLEEKRGTMSQ